jgi:hypothetical protein
MIFATLREFRDEEVKTLLLVEQNARVGICRYRLRARLSGRL